MSTYKLKVALPDHTVEELTIQADGVDFGAFEDLVVFNQGPHAVFWLRKDCLLYNHKLAEGGIVKAPPRAPEEDRLVMRYEPIDPVRDAAMDAARRIRPAGPGVVVTGDGDLSGWVAPVPGEIVHRHTGIPKRGELGENCA
jgi:hypothetical protein